MLFLIKSIKISTTSMPGNIAFHRKLIVIWSNFKVHSNIVCLLPVFSLPAYRTLSQIYFIIPPLFMLSCISVVCPTLSMCCYSNGSCVAMYGGVICINAFTCMLYKSYISPSLSTDRLLHQDSTEKVTNSVYDPLVCTGLTRCVKKEN